MFTVAVPLQCRCSISPFVFSLVESSKNYSRFHLYIFLPFNSCWFRVKYNHKIIPNTKLPLMFPQKHPSLFGDWLLLEDSTGFSRDCPPDTSARVLLLRTHPKGLLNLDSLKPLQLVPLSTPISSWTSKLLYLSLRLSPAWLQRKLILPSCLCDPLARDLGWGLQCRCKLRASPSGSVLSLQWSA